MPFKTRPIEVLRQEPRRAGPSRAEQEAATQFERLSKLIPYLRRCGHNGCIVLPLPLTMMNNGTRHWAEAAKLKKQYAEYCNLIYKSGLMPPMPAVRPQHVTVEVRFYVIRAYDQDNLSSMGKFVWDWLKGRYIMDDSGKHLTVKMLPQIVDRAVPRVEIRITAATPQESPPS